MAARKMRSTEKKIDPLDIAKRMIQQEMDLPIFIKHYISDAIGFGVFANMDIPKGSFLLEYPGELVEHYEGEKRQSFAEEINLGCFIFFFSFNGKQYCVDGTYSSRMGKFVSNGKMGKR
ncbi:N-lysine methyltransferase KMT5A-like [Hydra vulgaris]|uniref:N-lysine methyltransferase KMT5A-like n=1 Tax=Hydra vulgaris TaxID=6087 RepID=UPI001F5ED088|nr:N-lysine methyltransferase KMT5A-like [Hydra vulgaris]